MSGERFSQLRSLHMDDRGLNKHNAIMFLNNKTIGISWDIPMSVVVHVRGWVRWGKKKFIRPNIIQLAEHILNIYGSSFIEIYMDLLFTFHSTFRCWLVPPPHMTLISSPLDTGHKKCLAVWYCRWWKLFPAIFFLFQLKVFIVLCSIFRHVVQHIKSN